MKGGAGATLASLAVAQVHPIRFACGNYSKAAAVALPDPFHHFPPPQLTPGWPIFSAAVEPLRQKAFDAHIPLGRTFEEHFLGGPCSFVFRPMLAGILSDP